MDEKPKAVAWFVDEPIADDDPLAYVKRHAAALWAAGEVLEQAARSGTVAARADRIDPAADLAADEAFTADEVRDMWRASGLSDDDLDAAANVALELWTIERQRRLALRWSCRSAIAAAHISRLQLQAREGLSQTARPGSLIIPAWKAAGCRAR